MLCIFASSNNLNVEKMKANIFKKDGKLTAMHQEAMQSILNSNGKVHPNEWVGSFGHIRLRSLTRYVLDIANHYGYKVSTGNDAPRGGQEGFFIKFSSVAVKNLRAMYSEGF